MPDRITTYRELEAAGRQVEEILRRAMPSVIRLIEAFQALPPNARRAVEQLAMSDDLDRWESEGGATDA